jgi:hypothetical protein
MLASQLGTFILLQAIAGIMPSLKSGIAIDKDKVIINTSLIPTKPELTQINFVTTNLILAIAKL